MRKGKKIRWNIMWMNDCIEELWNRQDSKTFEEFTTGKGPPFSSGIFTYGTNAYLGGPEWGLCHLWLKEKRDCFWRVLSSQLSKVQRGTQRPDGAASSEGRCCHLVFVALTLSGAHPPRKPPNVDLDLQPYDIDLNSKAVQKTRSH